MHGAPVALPVTLTPFAASLQSIQSPRGLSSTGDPTIGLSPQRFRPAGGAGAPGLKSPSV
jgi:hypothetical protein